MAAKVTFDPAKREITVTQAPVNGVITLNIKVDLYSDGKEDWLVTPALQKMKFPIEPLGGNPIPIGVLGDSYILGNGWYIAPYEADHEMVLEGNLFPEVGYELVADTVGDWRVVVTRQVSTLVEIRETGVSGLTPGESTALSNIDSNVTTLLADVATLLSAQNLTNEQKEAEHTTSRTTGQVILRNTTALRRWEADAWEDEAQTIPYGTNPNAGIESVGMLVEVAWS